MPYVGIKTNQKLTNEQKTSLTEKLTAVFSQTSNPQISKFIQCSVDYNLFMNFKGNTDAKSVFVQALVAPNTTEEDKEIIIKGFFPIISECVNVPNENIYICVSIEPFWGINNNYVNFNKA